MIFWNYDLMFFLSCYVPHCMISVAFDPVNSHYLQVVLISFLRVSSGHLRKRRAKFANPPFLTKVTIRIYSRFDMQEISCFGSYCSCIWRYSECHLISIQLRLWFGFI